MWDHVQSNFFLIFFIKLPHFSQQRWWNARQFVPCINRNVKIVWNANNYLSKYRATGFIDLPYCKLISTIRCSITCIHLWLLTQVDLPTEFPANELLGRRRRKSILKRKQEQGIFSHIWRTIIFWSTNFMFNIFKQPEQHLALDSCWYTTVNRKYKETSFEGDVMSFTRYGCWVKCRGEDPDAVWKRLSYN